MDFNLIQRGELQERLARGLEIRERSPAPTLEPNVSPVVILEDLTRQSPFFQPVERRWGLAIPLTAVAGEIAVVAFTNPADSGVVTIVDSIIVSSPGTSPGLEWVLGRGSGAGLAPAGSGVYSDSRNGPLNPTLFLSGTNIATQLTEPATARRRVLISEDLIPESEIVLVPGEAWLIESVLANVAVSVSVFGRDYGV